MTVRFEGTLGLEVTAQSFHDQFIESGSWFTDVFHNTILSFNATEGGDGGPSAPFYGLGGIGIVAIGLGAPLLARATSDATLVTMSAVGLYTMKLTIDDGSSLVVQAGKAPVIDGIEEQRMRVGCGSATIGIFAQQWHGEADEVVVVDDHITGVLSEHQAGKVLHMPSTGIRMRGRRSTPGRYFQVAEPGSGWGGTDIKDPLEIIEGFDAKIAWPGMRLLMTSTTGEDALYCVLDDDLKPVEADMPHPLQVVVDRIGENCEPSLSTVLFMGGAGGSLRAGVTENPVHLTRSVRNRLTRVTMGGAPVYVWPGGGITAMVDVLQMPDDSFGHVPTPAIVAPIEFTLARSDYAELGGHAGHITSLTDVVEEFMDVARRESWHPDNPWPLDRGTV